MPKMCNVVMTVEQLAQCYNVMRMHVDHMKESEGVRFHQRFIKRDEATLNILRSALYSNGVLR